MVCYFAGVKVSEDLPKLEYHGHGLVRIISTSTGNYLGAPAQSLG